MNLEAVIRAFENNFTQHGEIGASLSIWQHGKEVLNLAQGWMQKEQIHPWTDCTLVPVYSATKAASAATFWLALERSGYTPQDLISKVWERFPIPQATFLHLLSHQCGLPALDKNVHALDHDAVVAAIEEQKPAWVLEHGHGYHPRTFSALLEEPVRRLTGKTLATYWREEIAEPLGLDWWMILPEKEHSRVAKLYPGKANKYDFESGFYQAFTQKDSLTFRAFQSPQGFLAVHEMNHASAWQAGLPAMSGTSTARSIAQFYQSLIGCISSPLSEAIQQVMQAPVISGMDLVLKQLTRFTGGCQQDPLDEKGVKLRTVYGASHRAFGHPGAGGSHGFADPDTGISFAYTMNQLELSVMPGIKCQSLIDALYS